MSRLGKRPIGIDSKLKVEYKDRLLKVKGPVGEMSFNIPNEVDLDLAKDSVTVKADFDKQEGRTMGGTVRSIVKSMIHGVSEGFTRTLELIGVGYRAQVSGQKLTLSLGYSHPVEFDLPKVVSAQVEGNTKIKLTSCNKQVLGQVIADIRAYRPPEPYKGKGILFEGEKILRKAGKAAKAAK